MLNICQSFVRNYVIPHLPLRAMAIGAGIAAIAAASTIAFGAYQVYSNYQYLKIETPPSTDKKNEPLSHLEWVRQSVKNFQLLTAIEEEVVDEAKIMQLIEQGANPNIKNKNGTPLLSLAIQSCRKDLIHFLVEKGADVNLADKEGRTPFYFVVEDYFHNVALLEFFIEKGADVNVKGKDGSPLLLLALRQKSPDESFIELLLKKGADGKALLGHLIEKEDLSVIETLVESGFDIPQHMIPKLDSLLTKKEASPFAVQILKIKKTKANELEIFNGYQFNSLKKSDQLQTDKPILIMNHSKFDHSLLSPYYGAMAQYYKGSFNHDFYKKMCQKFDVIRVRIDSKDYLTTVIEKVKNLAPHKVIKHWALNGHGNSEALGFNEHTFTSKDVTIMRDIANQLDPEATISLCGCNNAEGNNNLVKTFSEYSDGRIVIGCPTPVELIIPRFLPGDIFRFLPTFVNDNIQVSSKAYRNGELILDEVSTLRSRLRARL